MAPIAHPTTVRGIVRGERNVRAALDAQPERPKPRLGRAWAFVCKVARFDQSAPDADETLDRLIGEARSIVYQPQPPVAS